MNVSSTTAFSSGGLSHVHESCLMNASRDKEVILRLLTDVILNYDTRRWKKRNIYELWNFLKKYLTSKERCARLKIIKKLYLIVALFYNINMIDIKYCRQSVFYHRHSIRIKLYEAGKILTENACENIAPLLTLYAFVCSCLLLGAIIQLWQSK